MKTTSQSIDFWRRHTQKYVGSFFMAHGVYVLSFYARRYWTIIFTRASAPGCCRLTQGDKSAMFGHLRCSHDYERCGCIQGRDRLSQINDGREGTYLALRHQAGSMQEDRCIIVAIIIAAAAAVASFSGSSGLPVTWSHGQHVTCDVTVAVYGCK